MRPARSRATDPPVAAPPTRRTAAALGSPPGRCGPGRSGPDGTERRGTGDPQRAVATSPAVGIFHPRADARPGTRVRAGDRLGAVDMLGIPQDVVAPADGIVAQVLVEAGDSVEYGQELVTLELVTGATAGGGGAP